MNSYTFKNIELLLAIPEYKTALKGGSRASQSDVFALLRSEKGQDFCSNLRDLASTRGEKVV